MTTSQQPKVEKKAYSKPQVTEVRLVAEEAVLANCKTGSGGFTLCNLSGDPNCVPDWTSHS